MDIEVLDVLYTFTDPREWGYHPTEAWSLHLLPNCYADRYRKHRRARESRGERRRDQGKGCA